MMLRQATPLDLGLLIGVMAIWGLAFVGMKVIVVETGPFWMAASRSAFGLLIVLPIVLWRGLQIPRGLRQWALVIVICLLNFTVPVFLIGWAQLTLDAGISALLIAGGPFIAVLVGPFVSKDEPFTMSKLIAVFLGFGGIVSIVGVDAFSDVGHGHLLAQFTLILASLCYIITGYLVRRVGLAPLSLAAWTLIGSTIILVPVSYFVSGPVPVDLSRQAYFWVIFTGCVSTGLAFIIRFHLIQKIGYSMFAVGINLIPVFGVIFGALILGEVITLRLGFALFLVLSGLFIARLGGLKPSAKTP